MGLLNGNRMSWGKVIIGCASLISTTVLLLSCQGGKNENSKLTANSTVSPPVKDSSNFENISNSQIQWEDCEIVPITQSIPVSASSDMVPINFTYLWFQARQTSPKNISLGQTNDSDQLTSEELSSGKIAKTAKRERMMEIVKQSLLEQGWEESGEGSDWYNLHFRRKSSTTRSDTNSLSVQPNSLENISSGIKIFRMYQENFVEAEAKYKGKALTLDGTVSSIAPHTDAIGRTVGALVYIHDEKTPNGNGGLVLTFDGREQLMAIKPGNAITFTCTVGEWDGVPILLLALNNCSLK